MVAPLSDRYGRRPIVLLALGLFVLGSAAGIVAESLDMLVVARVVQAFGGGAAMSVMRATILDHFGPARAASALAATATAILVAPMLAPTIGGFVLEWLDWRAVFALSGILGFAVFLFASRNLRDARRADRSAGPVAALLVELPAPAGLARVPRVPGVRLVHGQHDLHLRDGRALRRDRRARGLALALRPAAVLPGGRLVQRLPARGAPDRPPRRPAHDAHGRDDRFRGDALDGGARRRPRLAPARALHPRDGDRLRQRDRGALVAPSAPSRAIRRSRAPPRDCSASCSW